MFCPPHAFISPFYTMLLLAIISACKRKPFLMNGFLQSNWKWTITNLFIYSCFFPFQCISPFWPEVLALFSRPCVWIRSCGMLYCTLSHCYIVTLWAVTRADYCNCAIVRKYVCLGSYKGWPAQGSLCWCAAMRKRSWASTLVTSLDDCIS